MRANGRGFTPGRRLKSVFYPRGNALEFITEGSVFRRMGPANTVETARVVSLYTDGTGIPHIRYMVWFQTPASECIEDGPRMLALRTFCELYRERVSRLHTRAV